MQIKKLCVLSTIKQILKLEPGKVSTTNVSEFRDPEKVLLNKNELDTLHIRNLSENIKKVKVTNMNCSDYVQQNVRVATLIFKCLFLKVQGKEEVLPT